MKKLLFIEWLTIRKNKTFWVLLALYFLGTIGINTIVSNFQENISTQTSGNIQLDLFHAPYLWNTTGWLTGFALLLPCFLIIVLVTNDFSYKTLRQRIINGLTRKEVIVSKWILIGFLSVFCWLIYVLTTLIVNHPEQASESLFSGFQFAGYTFLKIVLSLAIAFIFAIWLKKSGLSIALFLVYYFLVEEIVGHYLNKIVYHLGDFLPFSCGAELVPSPFSRYIITDSGGQPANYWFLIVGIGWLVLIIYLSFLYIRKADV